MSSRTTVIEYSEDGFAGSGANKGVLTLLFTGTALTGYMIDGTVMATGPDVSATLAGENATIREYEADDADGTADPAEKVLQCPAGGPLNTRSADGTTLAIAPRPPIPFARAVALRGALDALGYAPA